jgi:peptidyl-prolyl cis-trans isomerase SurA
MANKLKKKYHVNFDKIVLNQYLNNPKDTNLDSKILFAIKDKKYSVNDLKNYLKKDSRKTYEDFIDDKVIAYYKDHLAEENQDFANTLQEYQDGLLLFDLLQKKIWTKAEKDTVGLKQFYEQHITDYKWKKRVEADIASCTKKEKCNLVKDLLKENKTPDQIKDIVNDGATIHVLFTSGIFEVDSNKLPKNIEIKKGVTNVIQEDNNDFKVVRINKVLPESIKELDETKGKVISDYQEHLEKQWINDLHKKYKVKVEKKQFKKLKKKYK